MNPPGNRSPSTTPAAARPGRRGRGRRRGSSLVQLLVVCAIAASLLAIVIPVAARVRATAKSTRCLANLRGIASAFHLYAAANGRQLPVPAFTQVPWERSLQAYASADAFVCPGDEELAPATFSSYDWRDTGIDPTTLAGKNPYAARASAVLTFDALPGWHRPGEMNAARVDGSAGPMPAGTCVADLSRPAE